MVKASENLTIRDSIINLCNMCIGIGILAKPFALAVVGWTGIFLFFVAATVVTYAGICLGVACRELLINHKLIMMSKPIINDSKKISNYNSVTKEFPNNNIINSDIATKPKRMKSAYQLISYESMGTKGEIYAVVGFAAIACLITTTCIIMIFELLEQIISQILTDVTYIDTQLIFLFAFIIYIPAALVLNWKQMTFISWIGVISVMAILFTLIGLLILSLYEFGGPPPVELLIQNIDRYHIDINSTNLAINAQKHMTTIEGYAFSLIIFMAGIAGNAAVPKISASLKNKNHIIFVVSVSYIMVSLFYCAIACIGYWLYGEYTDVMIINNFFVWPNASFVIAVSVLVILNLWASFAIVLSLLSDVFDSLFNLKLSQFVYRRLMRMGMLSIVFILAYTLRYHLAFLVTLTGIIGVLCSLALLLPLMIYLATFWKHPTKQLSNISKIFHVILLILAILIGAVTCYSDFHGVL